MSEKTWLRRLGRWALRAFLALVMLEILHISALVFPTPVFAHRGVFEEFTVYSNEPLPAGFDRVAADARARIAAMENSRPGVHYRVFICGDERLYSVFAFLTRRPANSLAIGLSVFGNLYLNGPKIQRMARSSRPVRHSRFEGSISEVIAHEVAHFNIVRTHGYWAAMRMPVWKSEGYAEHQANLAATRADSTYAFVERVDLLRDDYFWGDSSYARQLFEWQLLVEHLVDVQGVDLAGLMRATVTEAGTREQMLAWYGEQRRTGD